MAIEFSLGNGQPLPPRSSIGYLDEEIAGEGTKIVLSDGEQVTWNPPPPKPVMPDMSEIKKIRHYFGRTGFAPYPAWLYHPTEPARIVKNAEEAAQLGVFFRRASFEEKGKYGINHVWDHGPESEWRPHPWAAPKFDPANPGQGKEYIPRPPDPRIAQNALIAELIPTVTAAVAAALQAGGGPQAPANIDAADWNDFLAFKAWKETQSAVESGGKEPDGKKGGKGK